LCCGLHRESSVVRGIKDSESEINAGDQSIPDEEAAGSQTRFSERSAGNNAMFFVLSKVLLYLILPPSGILLLMAVGFLIVKKKRTAGWVLIIAGFLLLYGLSTGPVMNSLVLPLEAKYPPLKDGAIHADAIVVLSGGVRDLSWIGLDPEPSDFSLERMVKGVILYRVSRRPLVITGGSGSLIHSEISEADAMARTALDLGVSGRDMVIENKSRNTLESARAVRNLLKGNRIILVTSAYHMKRSVAMFKKQGFDVVPAPVGYLALNRPLPLYTFIPSAEVLSTSAVALSEYISFAWYSMRGDL
jgi:uncharacterized SAM-binding protein YcdF (DUF218 family)